MTVIIQLGEKPAAALAAKAQAQGVAVEEYARQVLEQDLEAGGNVDLACKPIWEVIAESMKQVPQEDLDALPRDGASQIDHYVYGLPKRD